MSDQKSIQTVNNRACIDGVPLDNSFIFVSDGTWFEAGSICWLEANCGQIGGLFVGNRKIDNEVESQNIKMDIGVVRHLDGELCSWGEFDIYSKGRVLLVKAST